MRPTCAATVWAMRWWAAPARLTTCAISHGPRSRSARCCVPAPPPCCSVCPNPRWPGTIRRWNCCCLPARSTRSWRACMRAPMRRRGCRCSSAGWPTAQLEGCCSCIRRCGRCFSGPGTRTRVEDMVRASGLSHRHCIAVFRQATGLAPNAWLRLQRFSHALALAGDPSLGWADIAAASGFADQAHLANTFRHMAGVTPSAWRQVADPAAPRHVPR